MILRKYTRMIGTLFDDIDTVTKPIAQREEPMLPVDEPILTVSEYLEIVNGMLTSMKATVQGEITSVNMQGHNVFCTIADKEDNAKLNCYIYRRVLDNLGIELEEGTEVLFKGYAKVYKPLGKLSFTVTEVSLVGEGTLKKALERLLKKLEGEGLFSTSLKRPVPEYPVHIGLVTSKTGAAIQDFLTHLAHCNLKVHVVDTRVEGISAIKDIVTALRKLNESTIPLDVIVLTRGGGSLESLQAFNSEDVARALRACRVPVISAVGHEQDVTIADMASDLRVSTPTDAGKTLSANWIAARDKVALYQSSINSNFRKSLHQENQHLNSVTDSLLENFSLQLDTSRETLNQSHTSALGYIQRTDALGNNLQATAMNILRAEKEIQVHVKANIARYQTSMDTYFFHCRSQKQTLHVVESSLNTSIHALIRQMMKHLNSLEKSIETSGPLHRLQQGYSIVTNSDGKVLKSQEDITIGDTLRVLLHSGSLTSQVITKDTTKP